MKIAPTRKRLMSEIEDLRVGIDGFDRSRNGPNIVGACPPDTSMKLIHWTASVHSILERILKYLIWGDNTEKKQRDMGLTHELDWLLPKLKNSHLEKYNLVCKLWQEICSKGLTLEEIVPIIGHNSDSVTFKYDKLETFFKHLDKGMKPRLNNEEGECYAIGTIENILCVVNFMQAVLGEDVRISQNVPHHK